MTDQDPRPALDAAAELIESAQAVLVCAGAGIGVDSGLPDFRGDEGFWQAYPPYAELGFSFAEIADPVHFAKDPHLAWGFYGHRLQLYRRTEPHKGFAILRHWVETAPLGGKVFTSNVDGQFQKSGFASEDVIEAHGSIHALQCLRPCGTEVWTAEDTDLIIDESRMRALNPLPRCPNCGDVARPNILMFGDLDWLGAHTQEAVAGLSAWRRELRGKRLVTVEVGAGTAVPTVRRQAELSSATDSTLIRINPREPQVRHGRGIEVPLGALEALTAINERLG
ncbi:SIR2 family NAD-dependent protein deacylase [Sciscionella sediminilitoris]|uniref:SIR2 family NAD-dependent protein deacylase n=1 Tax=Sciscionella sediminilitoris TaxID=1445613 RepID=UPI0004DF3143|nr:Sir2 family NAD-dependent protein deacetylase [Sciscionella sp. SE31]